MRRDPRRPDPAQSGFTLAEMLVALAILVFGLTALAGSMTVGVSTRRGTEMRFRAVNMVDFVVRDLRENHLVAHPPDAGPLPDTRSDELEVFPGMKYVVKFVEDPDHPLVVLARIQISWREQGESVAEQFERVLIRERPFSQRISQLQGSTR
jgi:prepilin-type N-terminal cleavage/methylation domain-containing protein